jgi:phosphopantetheinyl transferase
LWARKEAYVKACGSTLFSELKRMSVPIEASAEKDGWFFHRLEAGSKYAAAVVSNKPVAQLPCYNFGASFR